MKEVYPDKTLYYLESKKRFHSRPTSRIVVSEGSPERQEFNKWWQEAYWAETGVKVGFGWASKIEHFEEFLAAKRRKEAALSMLVGYSRPSLTESGE